MRLLHTSDWHLGRTLVTEDLLPHSKVFLDWLLARAVEHRVDVVVVAGDVYDRAVPPIEAVRLLDETLRAFAQAKIPMLITSGNHDSPVRLGFGGALREIAGIHLRTSVAAISRPALVRDEFGEVAIYGMPYLLPDAVMRDLEAERSHASVLARAAARVKEDAAARGLARTVLVGHALVSGGQLSDSERDIRVGGIADVGAGVFGGFSYVALGHLHGQQSVNAGVAGTTMRYSGSPLPLSFSEKNQIKGVTLVEIAGDGAVSTQHLAAPVPRPMREVRGKLDELLARADTDLAELDGAWLKVTLTDGARPASPMERLRAKWPHTLALEFDPEGGLVDEAADLQRLAATTDPVEICSLFVEFVLGEPPRDDQRQVLRAAVEAAQRAEENDR